MQQQSVGLLVDSVPDLRTQTEQRFEASPGVNAHPKINDDQIGKRREIDRLSRDLAHYHFPRVAAKIVLVQDNLSTHKPASLYEAFPAENARRLVERFEWHCTPERGSWLDMAQSELSVLSIHGIDRRIPEAKPDRGSRRLGGTNKHHAEASQPKYKAFLAEAMALAGDLNDPLQLLEEQIAQVGRPGWQERYSYAEILGKAHLDQPRTTYDRLASVIP
jgi:hypothetical protein